MRETVLFAALALVPGLLVLQTAGGSPVAVVDFDRAVADTPEGKDALTKLNAFGNERRAAIEKQLQEAAEIENRLRTQGNALNDATRTRLVQELQDAQTSIETTQREAETRLGEMQQQLLAPVEARTAKVVNAYAAERGLRIVLDASVLRNGLVYVHDTADITSEVIRRLIVDLRTEPPSNALFTPREDVQRASDLRLQTYLRASGIFKPAVAFPPSQQDRPAE